ncbi:MAG: M43 family zinc metalloprotease, partial [Cyclobacteriaceae bacterium]|nr:M43 family zinc metalloprotease [Cyclobacteriaceae bacterium]
MKNIVLYIILLGLFLVGQQGFAQRCYTHEGDSIRGNSEIRKAEFENWILRKKLERLNNRGARTQATVVQIPVVFHVIHNGEPIGTETNLAEGQILSQLQVINEDFRRTNPDQTNTPAEFLPVAADVEIEFVLAKQDPEGLPTTAIVRVQGTQTTWKWEEQAAMKSLSYWPSDQYLNIWIADLIGATPTQNLLGYAQYPVSSTLAGLDMATDNPNFDGVAIDYFVTGSQLIYPQGNYNSKYNRGRSLTHELGHFFGLRHIWGDETNCTATDYCNDTPAQLNSSTGCPISQSTCSGNDMFQNYMDYSYDECMNIFTNDQKTRMRIVLENSPRRTSLTTSPGLQNPVIFDNDAGIYAVSHPGKMVCDGLQSPVVEVKNYGNNVISSVDIAFYLENNLVETKTFPVNLSYLSSNTVIFSPVNFNGGTPYNLRFEVVSVNGLADQRVSNDIKSIDTFTSYVTLTDIQETFQITPADWYIINSDNNKTWALSDAPNGTIGNKAMFINYYNYDALGELDWLVSPSFDLNGKSAALLKFDVAYANYPGAPGEALLVGVIQNCNQSLSAIDTVYYKSAANLETPNSGSTSSDFFPASQLDWRTEDFIDLTPYISVGPIQIVFIARNGYGNNMFIDNVLIETNNANDLELQQIVSPGYLSCETLPPLTIRVFNNGTDIIDNFTVNYSIDGTPFTPVLFSGVTLSPGQSNDITLPFNSLTPGSHTLQVELVNPNGILDSYPFNNSVDYSFEIDNQTVTLPQRENFNGTPIFWKGFSNNPVLDWNLNQLKQGDNYYTMPAFNTGNNGDENWLISPILDFNGFDQASMFFDVAYSEGLNKAEQLYIMLSEDCGVTYNSILYQKSGSILATTPYKENYFPNSDRD